MHRSLCDEHAEDMGADPEEADSLLPNKRLRRSVEDVPQSPVGVCTEQSSYSKDLLSLEMAPASANVENKQPLLLDAGPVSAKDSDAATGSQPLPQQPQDVAEPSLLTSSSTAALIVSPNDSAKTKLSVAASEDKGRRPTMEDVHVMLLDARGCDHVAGSSLRISFFGIWDGHGGVDCATFASERLHANALKAGLAIKRKQVATGQSIPDVKAVKECVLEAFKKTDEALLQACTSRGWTDGACAVCCWVVEELCIVANVGDAKAVLAREKVVDSTAADKRAATAGSAPPWSFLKAVTLTREHLALHAAERSRIEKSGGFVSADGRLNGRMQVSRSFGDLALKKAGCSSTPDIQAFELTDKDKFLVLGCDGFWGAWDGQGCVDMASNLLKEGKDDKGITNRLLNLAIRERGAKDNCSVMIIRFQRQ
ncbi:hypothetical protein CEUSTIGMA_g12740.t1 [Chlamydomonas eustigma]|uniref:PPM-type phosphatase domain-containing protein n=1 Tax=Chlamydomonas eustigma TaxID=1157962 RepID=A0A250XQM2_9CHLO|nr:hypothetical protein CEUSTIGMA_g12740.t1 [Chlamydomonas eustigma]|eukprot:GAX85323.1 hypothetical protein CEUSTIGMA_g12740.t1 [Chlamydomonas eustigma]